MIHKKITLNENDIIAENGIFILECPVCGNIHGSSDDKEMMPVFSVCYGTPTLEDWKSYKKERGLKNSDIAEIIGMSPDSVRNQINSSKPLPKWAISMLYEWKQ